MTKKDFELIAAVIRDVSLDAPERGRVARAFAAKLASIAGLGHGT